jgi:hypothetical protein
MSINADVWKYRTTWDTGREVAGYDVEAVDGSIGEVDAATTGATQDAQRNCLVVDTGFWIFGKKRLLPVGVVDRVDHDHRTVYVSMTKDEIKQAPDFDDTDQTYGDEYYDEVGGYYDRRSSS